jgi:RNA polymerase sigma-70 factor, ECF subfamily
LQSNVLSSRSSKERDLELLGRVAQGDRRAVEELYVAYHRRLSRFLARSTPRYETIEEIINDTFLVVWQQAGKFRGASQVSTWIIGIAYRIALKAWRRDDAHRNSQLTDELPEHSVEPALELERQDWIASALRQLPIEQQMTIELAYNLGHSMEEIAAITHCPVGTVKARMFHAREKLRQYLPALAGLATAPTPEVHRPS